MSGGEQAEPHSTYFAVQPAAKIAGAIGGLIGRRVML
jgi:hypothetical protein